MNIAKTLFASLLLLGLTWHGAARAQASTAAPSTAAVPAGSGAASINVQGTQYSKKGADTCLECHDTESDTTTHTTAAIFKSPHARRGNSHSPFGKGGLQCEACHGPGANHSIKNSKQTLNINSLKSNSFYSPAQRNQACLSCHQDSARNAWHGAAHDFAQLACTDCHKLHAERDPVLAKTTEAEVCFQCHKAQRTEFLKTSAHPLRNGRMACSDCHSTHGTSAPALLKKPTLNQTCFSCHADKRGPTLWEHAPVAEDCSLCHNSHGSVQPALLARNVTSLCQDCHSVSSHPAVARTGAALPGAGGGGSIFVVAGGCTNCHAQVHGSNHPAGAKLMR